MGLNHPALQRSETEQTESNFNEVLIMNYGDEYCTSYVLRSVPFGDPKHVPFLSHFLIRLRLCAPYMVVLVNASLSLSLLNGDVRTDNGICVTANHNYISGFFFLSPVDFLRLARKNPRCGEKAKVDLSLI